VKWRDENLPDDAHVRCGNCAWAGRARDLHDAPDLEQRVEAGGEVPAGECPSCGALAYVTRDDETIVLVRFKIAPGGRPALDAALDALVSSEGDVLSWEEV
jgi:hypothetical protein